RMCYRTAPFGMEKRWPRPLRPVSLRSAKTKSFMLGGSVKDGFFAAVHESAIGTKRRFIATRQVDRFWSQSVHYPSIAQMDRPRTAVMHGARALPQHDTAVVAFSFNSNSLKLWRILAPF